MDNKTLATILFRVTGISYLVFSIFYAPYVLLTASYNHARLSSPNRDVRDLRRCPLGSPALGLLTYVAGGVCLLIPGKPLASLIVKGLDRNTTSLPPPPPKFERR